MIVETATRRHTREVEERGREHATARVRLFREAVRIHGGGEPDWPTIRDNMAALGIENPQLAEDTFERVYVRAAKNTARALSLAEGAGEAAADYTAGVDCEIAEWSEEIRRASNVTGDKGAAVRKRAAMAAMQHQTAAVDAAIDMANLCGRQAVADELSKLRAAVVMADANYKAELGAIRERLEGVYRKSLAAAKRGEDAPAPALTEKERDALEVAQTKATKARAAMTAALRRSTEKLA